jgi:hypothetical protein
MLRGFKDLLMTTEFAPRPVSIGSGKPSTKLGEELPLFCEKCGYGLQGAPQIRCEHCNILQFHCPECGHHQPINTLRPAAQRIIGRLRAVWLGWVMLFKLNYFGWLLFAWFAMGVEWSYSYDYYRMNNTGRARLQQAEVSFEMLLGFGTFALAFGLVSRIFLLRWRNSRIVGLVLCGLVLLAVYLGVQFRFAFIGNTQSAWTLSPSWMALFGWTAGLLFLGCLIAWPVWVGLARLFLPPGTAEQFIRHQRSLSDRPVASLGRD